MVPRNFQDTIKVPWAKKTQKTTLRTLGWALTIHLDSWRIQLVPYFPHIFMSLHRQPIVQIQSFLFSFLIVLFEVNFCESFQKESIVEFQNNKTTADQMKMNDLWWSADLTKKPKEASASSSTQLTIGPLDPQCSSNWRKFTSTRSLLMLTPRWKWLCWRAPLRQTHTQTRARTGFTEMLPVATSTHVSLPFPKNIQQFSLLRLEDHIFLKELLSEFDNIPSPLTP